MANGSNISQLGQTLNNMAKSHVKVQTCWVTVQEVDWNEKTMTAIGLTDELPFYDVQLGVGSFYRKPAVGSMCLIGIIENQDAATFLIDAENVEEAVYTSGESEFTIKLDGFIIQRAGESFKTVLNDFQTQVGKLCEELAKVVVLIGTGPDLAAIAAIKQQVDGDIKDRFNTIFKA
jgi:hypothetical protein